MYDCSPEQLRLTSDVPGVAMDRWESVCGIREHATWKVGDAGMRGGGGTKEEKRGGGLKVGGEGAMKGGGGARKGGCG